MKFEQWYQKFIGDGYRLLTDGELRQPGDEFILPQNESGSVRYWPWDRRFDSAYQGECSKPTRRKVAQ